MKRFHKATFWVLTIGVLTTPACKMGPDYERPETPEPVAYQVDQPQGESIANTPWWELYQDPVLQELIRRGLESNRSLREAMARITESRASLGMVEADLYPGVRGIGAVFSQRTPQIDTVSTFDNFKLAAAASYEVDLWGRVRRSNEAAQQGLMATEEAYRTVTISLVAEIAAAYMVLRDLDARLDIAEQTLATRHQSLEIMTARAEGGLVSVLDIRRAEMELADTEAAIQALLRGRAQVEHGISLLVGETPSSIARGMTLAEQSLPPAVPAGLPSELLQRRPDILMAERALHAQTARIGVAVAMRFPSLSLTGNLGVKSTTLGEATSNNLFLNLGGSLAGSIIDWGRNEARVEVEKARTEQLLNQYEQTILNSLREVEDALVAVETYRTEHEARQRQLEAARDAYGVVSDLYEGGLTSYSEVLDVQRGLFGAQLMASEALQLHHTSVIQLYRALGGGWNVDENEGSSDSAVGDPAAPQS